MPQPAGPRAHPSSEVGLFAAKGFGRYQPEAERAVRSHDFRQGKGFQRIMEEFVDYFLARGSNQTLDCDYGRALGLIGPPNYSSGDVEAFSALFMETLLERIEARGKTSSLMNYDACDFGIAGGIFISALVNNGKGKSFTIHVRPEDMSLNYLGYKNSKEILVKGNAGEGAGCFMEGGSMIVEADSDQDTGGRMKGGLLVIRGNAVDAGPHMEGGTIIVEGNALSVGPAHPHPYPYPAAGEFMQGGKIIIHGDALGSVGQNMEGGEIHVGGEIGAIGDVRGGRIYQRGRLVFPKGG